MSLGFPRHRLIGIAVALLALAAAACRQSEESKQQAALEKAYKAGLIEKNEYEAKKVIIAGQASQLAALDKARDAGLVTPAEYEERKQRLTGDAAAPPALQTAGGSNAVAGATVPSVPSVPSIPNGPNVPNGVRQENIFDPHLKLNAYNVRVPESWKFDGVYVPGSSCSQIPFPVFRMYSPDGLTEIRRLPRFDWNWSTSRFHPKQQADCLDLKQELSAQEFLKYIIGVMQVAYVRDYPIPQQLLDNQQKGFDQSNGALLSSAQKLDQMNASLPSMRNMPKHKPAMMKGGMAAAIAEYRNGTFTIEEQIVVTTLCTYSPLNSTMEPDAFTETCGATVRIARAPKGQLDGLITVDQKFLFGAADNPEWVSKYLEYQRQVSQAFMDQMNRASQAQMQASHNEFMRAQAVRSQQHQEFLATMREGTDRSMARASAAANSRHAIAQDWCDYALDRQTVSGPGGTLKVSNTAGQTWTDGSGHFYQTNNPSANPNGVLGGNWTMTTQVHGDGSAK